MNECILGYEAARGGAPTCCWLRLPSEAQGLVALVCEVAGNPGPPVAATGLALRRALAEQVGLDLLAALVLVTAENGVVNMQVWEGAPGEGAPAAAPLWRAGSPSEVAALVGQPLPRALAPFWQPLPDCVPNQAATSLRCEVAGGAGRCGVCPRSSPGQRRWLGRRAT